ncbi:MAG: hypothetical protein QXP66_04315 [Candidatus Aenigmatarchaeota archaeon]
MKQFFYSRVEGEKVFTDSFNIENVIRTIEIEEGKRLVVLNDFHEEIARIPVKNKKGEVTSYKNERYTEFSKIVLEKSDSERFVELFK